MNTKPTAAPLLRHLFQLKIFNLQFSIFNQVGLAARYLAVIPLKSCARRHFLSSIVLAAALAACLRSLAAPPADSSQVVLHLPRISPEYHGTTIPPNIAPLNFLIQEPGRNYRVRIHSAHGELIELHIGSPAVVIPLRAWRALLRANPGQPLYIDIAAQDAPAQWGQFTTITNSIAHEEIDGYLVYRLLGPLYNYYTALGIYQRDLQSYAEVPILRNDAFNRGCVNCHTFLHNNPATMALNIREKSSGNPLLLVRSNQVVKVAQTAGYLSWHPSGRLLAFSANKLSLFFHTTGETRDVFDANSDLRIYYLDSNRVAAPAVLARSNRQETWPAWSPDGRFLYFCSAPKVPFERFREIRYGLVRVAYDLDHDAWSDPETLISAHELGLSAAQPKVSPDGRSVLFCLCKYGNFPVYQPSSDLYLLDLATRQPRRLEINSDQADSWHSWSSNGRWIVFSSKRRDGLFSRPYFSYVDDQGVFHKPFLLPQRDPAFYDSFLKNYNVPELTTGPVPVTENQFARAILKPRLVVSPTTDSSTAAQSVEQGQESATPPTPPSDPQKP